MTAIVIRIPLPSLPHGSARPLTQVAHGIAAKWRAARLRRATQRYLAEMDDHMLSDIGVSRAQALFDSQSR